LSTCSTAATCSGSSSFTLREVVCDDQCQSPLRRPFARSWLCGPMLTSCSV
jgi:hypothetical protein